MGLNEMMKMIILNDDDMRENEFEKKIIKKREGVMVTEI